MFYDLIAKTVIKDIPEAEVFLHHELVNGKHYIFYLMKDAIGDKSE